MKKKQIQQEKQAFGYFYGCDPDLIAQLRAVIHRLDGRWSMKELIELAFNEELKKWDSKMPNIKPIPPGVLSKGGKKRNGSAKGRRI